MKLIFPAVKIPALAEKYIKDMNKRDRELTEQIALIFPEYRKRGYLT